MKKISCSSFRRIIAVSALILALGSGQAMAQRAEGIDVSRWQGTINWTSVAGAGKTFAWAQATRGAYLTNVNFVANMNNGKAAGVLMAPYHYATPATNSAAVEADYFWNLAGPYIKADGKTLMPMLDIEEFNGHVGATSYSDWANQWANSVIGKASAAGVTIKVLLYSSASKLCNFNSTCSGFGSHVANWSGDSQTGTPWSCCTSCNLWGGGAWNFWQYSDTGSVPGISGNVDLDVYNGTVAELSTWVAAAAVADTTPPVISGVTASGISDTSASITWNTDENSDSVVEYGTTTTYDFTVSDTSMASSHSIGLSGLSASTLYHYRVKSKDAAGNLATSGDFTFTTLASGSVADIIIDNPAATIVGSWSTGSSATDKYGADYKYKGQGTGTAYLQYTPNILTAGDYNIYEWHTQGANRDVATPHVITYNGGTITINVNQQVGGGAWNLLGTFNFSTGTTKYLRITDAISTAGQIALADAIKFVYAAAPCALPSVPTALSATGGNSQIALNWAASSGAASYDIRRAPSSGGPYTQIASGVTSTSYTDTGLASGSSYFYTVAAVNACGTSANSAYIGAATIPATPTGLSATAGNAQVALTWTASTGASSYNVKRATVSGGPYTAIASPTAASYTDTTAVNGTTYYYVASAVNSSGESANSTQVSATPTAPTVTNVHVKSIAMSWVKIGGKYKTRAVVNVVDASGVAVSAATVTGDFTGSISNLGLTGATTSTGDATVTSTIAISKGTVTFTVKNITGTNLAYDSAANVITAGTISR